VVSSFAGVATNTGMRPFTVGCRYRRILRTNI
jgi:hypothetical protein